MTPRQRLEVLPRLALGPSPTPLVPLPRFSAELGAEVWAKRDDVGSVGLAGNKVRKLELILARARLDGADTVITTGAVQSNSARCTAAAAAMVGLRCILVLTGPPPRGSHANLLLDRLFGAEVRLVGPRPWDELGPLLAAEADAVAAAGGRAVIAPVGASSPLGALGFALAYLELAGQLDAAGLHPAVVLHASTSGGTHAGLVLGRAIAGHGPPVLWVDVGRVLPDPAAGIARLATRAGALIGWDAPVTAGSLDLDLDHAGDGYGVPTAAADDAIRLLARTEGIVCDPVYSGKALAALVSRVGRHPAPAGPVVFWHTGGWHACFEPGHADRLAGP